MEGDLEDFDCALKSRARFCHDSLHIGSWYVFIVVAELEICGLYHYRQRFVDHKMDGRILIFLKEDHIRAGF